MSELPDCPECKAAYTYEDRSLCVCPSCGHEWDKNAIDQEQDFKVIKDSNGTILKDGDTIALAKDLKVKGSSTTLKVGTKVKNIRLVEGDHNIDCKIEGFGALKLKSELVNKVM